MRNNNQKKGKDVKRQLLLIIITIILVYTIIYFIYPHNFKKSIKISQRYGLEMLTILPAVLLLMGLADVWVPKSLVKKYLGKNAGLKGIFVAIALGTLPTGPMYIAFPVASELLRKKASLTNVIIFLGVWASLKIPQIGVEIQFLGVKFALIRLSLTFVSIVAIGFITGYLCQDELANISQSDGG